MAGNKFFRLQRIKQQLKRFVALPLVFFALCLFVFMAKSDAPFVLEGRRAVYDTLTPVLKEVMSPIDLLVEKVGFIKNYVFVYQENERLRAENQQLRGWQYTALQLAQEQKELFLHLKYEPHFKASSKYVRMLGEYNSPFTHAIVLEGGTQQGIFKGDVLMQENALFGHVIEVNLNTSRALKLTDYFSRLPVFVGADKTPAILMGDNQNEPVLTALPEEHHIKEGDRVVSAGIAGVYPEGLMIGYVSNQQGDFRVNLVAKKGENSFIQVIHFNLGGLIEDTAKSPLLNKER